MIQNQELRANLIQQFTEFLDHKDFDDIRAWTIRPAKRKPVEPGDTWEQYESGPTIYFLLAIGDRQHDRENEVEKILETSL